MSVNFFFESFIVLSINGTRDYNLSVNENIKVLT